MATLGCGFFVQKLLKIMKRSSHAVSGRPNFLHRILTSAPTTCLMPLQLGLPIFYIFVFLDHRDHDNMGNALKRD